MASATLLCYCLAHLTIYELIHAIVLEVTELRFHNFHLLYSALLVTGLTFLRLSGFLWLFLSGKRYRQTKNELEQRRKQGCWDVRVHDWLEDRPYLKAVSEIVGFYICYISLGFFWNQFLALLFDQSEAIYEQLPSAQHRLEHIAINNGSDIANAEVNEACKMEAKYWEEQDYEFIYRTVAKIAYYHHSGDKEAPLFSALTVILAYVAGGSLSIFFLSQAGCSFADSW